MKETEKKQTHFLRIAMMVLTTILIVLFFMIMSMVGKIQGTARVINYAGLVRGGTQRMVKLEISGEPQDKMYETISSYIEGLRYGSDKLNFVRLADKDFQNKMDELAQCFEEELRSELLLVREKGYENTDIISKSEHFFQICDEAVSYAEVIPRKKPQPWINWKSSFGGYPGPGSDHRNRTCQGSPFCRTEQDPSEKSLPR